MWSIRLFLRFVRWGQYGHRNRGSFPHSYRMWYCRFLFWLYTFPHPKGQGNFSWGWSCCWFNTGKYDSSFFHPEYFDSVLLTMQLLLVMTFAVTSCEMLWWTDMNTWGTLLSAGFRWLKTTFPPCSCGDSDVSVSVAIDSSTERNCHGSNTNLSATKSNNC